MADAILGWLPTLRYGFAVFLVATLPPAILWWFVIHPLTAFWRRVGKGLAFTVVTTLGLTLVGLLVHFRHLYMRETWPFHWGLALLGAGLYVVAVKIEIECRRLLRFPILAGVPQLSRDDPGRLLTEGIYARTRNPRYLDILIGVLGWALILNVPAVYVVWALSVPGIYLVILLEERELKERFGEEYERYLERVPRLVPRWGG